MYQRILVALDGSERAERVLSHVEPLARAMGSTLILLRAATPPETIVAQLGAGTMAPAAGLVDPLPLIQAEQDEVAGYLERIATRLREAGLTVQSEHPAGPAGEVILHRADRLGVDLIAMTTHGRTGFGRLIFGSVAEEVLRRATCPILLMRVAEHDAATPEHPTP